MLSDMMRESRHPPRDAAFRALYPNLTEPELKEAEENFAGYVELAVRMWQRIEADPAALAGFRELTRKRSRR
jgi:hypothetical protein